MKLIQATLTLLFAFTSTLHAQDLKIGTVDMQRLVKEFHETEEAQKELSLKQTRMQAQNKARLERIRAVTDEIENLKKKLQDGALAENKLKELEDEFRNKSNEGIALERERREHFERRTRALNESINRQMRSIVEKISDKVSAKARDEGYHFIFDTSSMAANGFRPLTYSKDSYDLTAEILKNLNADAPAKPDQEQDN